VSSKFEFNWASYILSDKPRGAPEPEATVRALSWPGPSHFGGVRELAYSNGRGEGLT
jgi:hypothetical protein